MVLFYNSLVKTTQEYNYNRSSMINHPSSSVNTSLSSNPPSTVELNSSQSEDTLVPPASLPNMLNKPNQALSFLGGSGEFYYTLLEDNFNNLSIDDKLIVIHRTSMLRYNIITNYIIICLAILVLIAIRIFLK